MGKALIIPMAALGIISGCQSIPSYIEDPRAIWCDHNEPRRDATETTPRAELDQINTHNLRGAKWCGWKP